MSPHAARHCASRRRCCRTVVPAFHGPWHFNSAFAQSKPIKVGLTCDASGQYAASGQDDLRGIRMALDEVNAAGRRARPQHRVGHRRYRNQSGDRHPRRPALRRRGMRIPHRRGPLRRRPCDHPDRRQIRRDLPQHQLLGAERGARELQPHQVRVGRQRHQFRQGRGHQRHQHVRDALSAADQRLRMGQAGLRRDAHAGAGARRPHRRRSAGTLQHARFRPLPAQASASSSPMSSPPRSAASTSRRCASRSSRPSST